MGVTERVIEATSTSDLRVRYAETDAMGIVYYANYFVWFEIGRTDWIRRLGLSYREFEERGVYLPVVNAQCTYKASARYDDLVRIETTVTSLTPARIGFSYRALRVEPAAPAASDGPPTLLAEGGTDHVFLNQDGRVTRLDRHPELWSVLQRALSPESSHADG